MERNIQNFFLLNYWQDHGSASVVAKSIANHQFDCSAVEFLCGPSPPRTLTYEKFKERLEELFEKFYKHDGKPSEVITIPIFTCKTKINQHMETQIWEQPMNILKEWCEKYEKCGLIVRNYNIKSHLGKSKIKIDMNENFVQCHERLLVFNPAQRVILTIYFVESPETFVEVHNCIDEVNVLGLLLRDELSDSGLIVTGIVVCSENISHGSCIDCESFIVSYNIFTSIERFIKFWDSFIGQNVYKRILKNRVNNDKVKTFEAVATKIVGFLAHIQYETSDKPELPTPKISPEENIAEAELLLNRYQMEVVYSGINRYFITGSYGTGKSLIIYKKIQVLLENLKDKEIIYYVNFEEKSHLNSILRMRIRTSDKVKAIRSGFDLSHIIEKEILPKEDYNVTKTIHLMVDEYDTQRLSSREVKQLNELFGNQEQLKNSTIFIAAQSIEISRDAYEKDEGEKKKILELKPIPTEELKKCFYNINFYNLINVMRMTIEIYELARVTQMYLDKKSNDYTETIVSDHTSSCSPEDKRRKKSSINSPQDQHLHYRKRVDYDEYFSVLDTPNKKSKNYRQFVTSYSYNLESQIGHSISGDLPELFRLPKLDNKLQQIELIVFLLSRIIEINSKRVAIIHFESQRPRWLGKVLSLNDFQGLTINFDAGKFINPHLDQDKQKKEIQEVLVTDFRCVKGLEFSDVLLLLNENEYHCKHFLPEAISRCMSKLSILLVPCHKEFDKSGETGLTIAKEWEQINSNRLGNPILKIVNLKFCSDNYCRHYKEINCENENSICLHKSHKFYEKLHEEIKNEFASNWQSDNEKEKEDANSS